jgi:hypothetical protein
MSKHLRLVAALGMVLGLAGCTNSEPLVPVRGRVHKNGQPLPVKDLPSAAGGRVTIVFHSLEKGENSTGPYGGVVTPDGNFSVSGNSGKGIPPGKYRVEIKWQDPFPHGKDQLEGKFGKDNSPVVVDIPSPGEVDIDVAKVSGKK